MCSRHLPSLLSPPPASWPRAPATPRAPRQAGRPVPCLPPSPTPDPLRQAPNRRPGATPRAQAAAAPRGAASGRCCARPERPGAPLCPPRPALGDPALPLPRRAQRSAPGRAPPPALPLSRPTRHPRAPPARPGLPSSHGCRVPSPLPGRSVWRPARTDRRHRTPHHPHGVVA
jgi:hypothetical protein